MSDITTRLRQTRADMIGTDDEQHYWDCHDAAAEIERLRLTDAERAAIECGIQAIGLAPYDERTLAYADKLRGLLERMK
jgi:hypothetical protein